MNIIGGRALRGFVALWSVLSLLVLTCETALTGSMDHTPAGDHAGATHLDPSAGHSTACGAVTAIQDVGLALPPPSIAPHVVQHASVTLPAPPPVTTTSWGVRLVGTVVLTT